MKRIALAVLAAAAVVGIVIMSTPKAHAAPDTEPWRSIFEQRQHKVPQKFDREVQASFVDAGVVTGATVNATTLAKLELVDAGHVNVQGTLGLNRAIHCGADIACGTIALSSGTPSTATKTVTAGATCFCWPVGTTAAIAAAGCAASVSSTTATFTGPNSVTTTVGYICFL